MSGTESVKVVVRVRPLNSLERSKNCLSIIQMDKENNNCTIMNTKTSIPKSFTFDSVFDQSISQQEIYEDTAFPLVESVLKGYNGTIFAYGQTGCGKTFTMSGNPCLSDQRGIIPNSFSHIFEAISLSDSSQMFLVRCSYLEIYNEEIRDLLDYDPSLKLELKETKEKEIFVKNLSIKVVKSFHEIDQMMNSGNSHRITKETNMNEKSSRSHAIFTIYIETSETNNNETLIRAGKLNLVDLAGSERQKKTGATGERMKEAIEINLSLSALGNVISSLVDGNATHVPYRDSKLTRLLQDSLGGNTKTVMIAVISPADYNYDESLSTLRYASRAKFIQNKPKINEDPKDALIREYHEEIQKLKKMLEDKNIGPPIFIERIVEKERIIEKEVIVEKEKFVEVPKYIKIKGKDEFGLEKIELGVDEEEKVIVSKKNALSKSRSKGSKKSELIPKGLELRMQGFNVQQADYISVNPSNNDVTLGPNSAFELPKMQNFRSEQMQVQLKPSIKLKHPANKYKYNEELEHKEQQLREEIMQRLKLESALEQLKQKFISGGDASIEVDKEKLKKRREKRKNNKKVQKVEENKEKYQTLQEEVDYLRTLLKTVELKYQAALAEIEDLHKEHEREKEELLDTIRSKDKECIFFSKVFEYLLPLKELSRIKKLSKFDENNSEWHIKPFSVQSKQIMFPKLPKTQIIDSIQADVKGKTLIFQRVNNGQEIEEGDEVVENQKLWTEFKNYENRADIDKEEFRPTTNGLTTRELNARRLQTKLHEPHENKFLVPIRKH